MYSHVTFDGNIIIGNRYLLRDDRYGICKYYGIINKKKYIGIELEIGEGDTNGIINGKRYFKCSKKRGIFVTRKELKKDLGKVLY